MLAFVPPIVGDDELTPKEKELLNLCLDAQRNQLKTLVYTIYSGKRDTMQRLKGILESHGLKMAVLRSTVPADRREDWIADQLEKSIDGLICNPACVETGLDLLDFNRLIFMQTGARSTLVEQASKRSWRIGQTRAVDVYFLGYAATAQVEAMKLMAQKIQVSQSASGEIPASGLESLNIDDASIEVALARQLIKHAA